MPQMSPMLWLVLFIYFLVLFMFYISNMYFTFTPMSDSGVSVNVQSRGAMIWLW